ncbi:UDP-2,3-diacylglucosamine diphosphatase [Otariodibacter oris]|uniref:UDP-2,3-diacylglucosamine hydrolase n=1 Tax=Otariodibacter oris TaxID=1032623 RepID=A0A420XF14_9PAST|nr:UDP-2,3-diacylglucosamine diphosphatase [Otariodibacter oris]QGM81504.1 UDP-2,3-diacylglucosamine diphosphatase [Otariodibacter oris]RKR71110.1 UDP-2,3-diacylglucosamine hydrolase [Otariodibacter oris]
MQYFIADLHLNESQPEITDLFLQFMQEKAPLAEAIYILGDLFDFWIGDDEQSELITQVKQATCKVVEQGVPCYFICGNRDFLIGKRFAKESGMTLLPDYHIVDLYGKRTLICHGDTLCIDDEKYQNFRKKVHQKWLQWLFLKLPLSLRINIAQKIRAKSKQDKQHKPIDIMDVNKAFTAEIVEKYQAEWLIHGHTHRQAVHSNQHFANSDRTFTRIVLGDWGKTASILTVTPDSFYFNEER